MILTVYEKKIYFFLNLFIFLPIIFKYNRQFWPTLANMHTLDYPYGQFKAVVKQLEYYIQLYYAHI